MKTGVLSLIMVICLAGCSLARGVDSLVSQSRNMHAGAQIEVQNGSSGPARCCDLATPHAFPPLPNPKSPYPPMMVQAFPPLPNPKSPYPPMMAAGYPPLPDPNSPYPPMMAAGYPPLPDPNSPYPPMMAAGYPPLPDPNSPYPPMMA